MIFDEIMKAEYEYANEVIHKYAILPEEGYQKTVINAMNYSLLAGGKRLRPIMMHSIFEMCLGKGKLIEPFMAAIEMIHTYSLVHDDLPAMDNDMLRRGMPTTHAKYGEDMAILTGDALLNRAFEVSAQAFDEASSNEDVVRIARAIKVLGNKAGIYGMVGGQTYDVEAERKSIRLDAEAIDFIFVKKTAALIECSMMIGAILAGASEETTREIEQAARYTGIAFQIQDDILDITSTEEVLGKPIGSDEKNNKITYVTLNGIEKSSEDVEILSKKALLIIDKLEYDTAFVSKLIESLIDREK